jgi:hypothetical protein
MKDYGAVNMGIRRLVERSKKDKSIRKAMGRLDEMFKVQTWYLSPSWIFGS